MNILLVILFIVILVTFCFTYSDYKKISLVFMPLYFLNNLVILFACSMFIFSFFSVSGIYKFPDSYEVPIYRGSALDSGSNYFVASKMFGRIQVYDNNMEFKYGFNIITDGGTSKVYLSDNNIVVLSRRFSKKYTYSVTGDLLAKDEFSDDFWNSTKSKYVLFSKFNSVIFIFFYHPVLCWFICAIFFGLNKIILWGHSLFYHRRDAALPETSKNVCDKE
ncbi:MAG: hypothetical protein JXR63_02445 [Spirochaetales bacterium]|nr:hypothetical protein [Spirochaetales bacterium]